MAGIHAFDDVLRVAPPRFDEEAAARIARELFGVEGVAIDAGSERDQTFLIDGAAGSPDGVLKMSNLAEVAEILDMEALAALHAVAMDPELPVAAPWVVPGADPSREGPAAYRAVVEDADGKHFVRFYDRMPGLASVDETTLSDEAIRAWGTTAARLTRSLRGFFHPSAQRVMLWDVQHASKLRPLLDAIDDAEARALVSGVLDRFDEVVAPVWPRLRAQVMHGDLTSDNALVDEKGFITGIVDFGDMSHTALVADLASILESLLCGRTGDELFRTARIAIDGYEAITPLEPVERALVGELVAAQTCGSIAISAWRAKQHPDGAGFTLRFVEDAITLLEELVSPGWDRVRAAITGETDVALVGFDSLLARRRTALGSALVPLTYDRPLHLVRGEGPWLFDAEGERYLDCYNNVPSVGHAHPRVAGAIARQARELNTNMRYLHQTVIELAERLISSTPPELDTVMFVNSGSEANDLAWRLATVATGKRGGICTAYAYHGVTEAIAALSPESWPGGRKPDHIETFAPPDAYRGEHLGTDGFVHAVERLQAGGHGLAAVYLDGILTSDGILDLEPDFVQELVGYTHDASGLWVADEVQGGHGRTGDALWSFQRFGIVPDFVTLGKPMGNGHPIAAVITKSAIVNRFAQETDWFSTFAGNPVAAAAAVAVLDVIDDERVLDRAAFAGEALRSGLRDVAARHEVVGDVRGIGLANAVEFVSDRAAKSPHPDMADRVANAMRDRGVLVGATGMHDSCLKIRPPLAFTEAEVPLVVEALDGSLAALAG